MTSSTIPSLRIAIAGNPNCGKTTLFNRLTGSQQRVGNWAGVTVEKKTGILQIGSDWIEVTDLPGVYSLTVADKATSLDEQIACRHLLSITQQPKWVTHDEYEENKSVDLVINIVDAAHLKRHLYLTRQLLEMPIPCIVVLNMMDVAAQKNITINVDQLAAELGCQIVPMICTKNQGIQLLKQLLMDAVARQAAFNRRQVAWPMAVGQAIQVVQAALVNSVPTQLVNTHQDAWMTVDSDLSMWWSLRLLEKDALAEELQLEHACSEVLRQQVAQLEQQWNEESDIIFADCRYQWIERVVNACQQQSEVQPGFFSKIDKWVMHPILGILIFFLMMYFVFEFSMSVGALLQPFFDISTTTIFVEGTQYLGDVLHIPHELTLMMADGFGLGINTVASFIPQIALLFLALSFLEDCGYMARAAFVMDRVMQAIGLPSKSFIPLMIGFGCNVPAVMATRTLDSVRDRVMTALMVPFMSCGARLAIFVVFGVAFFPSHSGLIIFLLYFSGILMALLTGLILKLTLLRGASAPFILDIPQYHLPALKNLGLNTWQRLRNFMLRAGKTIVVVCIIVGSLNSLSVDRVKSLIGLSLVSSAQGSPSCLAFMGQKVTPLLAPMGITQQNWPATVSLLTGTLAKEVVVGTLNTLYTQNNRQDKFDPHRFHLWRGLANAVRTTVIGFKQLFSTQMLNPFTVNLADSSMTKAAMGHMVIAFGNTWAAISYLFFVLLYMPCISTLAALAREVGLRWAYLSFLWSTGVAYGVAVCCYQLRKWIVNPERLGMWLIGIGFLLFIGLMLMRRLSLLSIMSHSLSRRAS